MNQRKSAAAAKLQALMERRESANTRLVRLQARFEAEQKEYRRLCEIAEQNYGTSDLGKLRDMCIRDEADNQAKVANFDLALKQIEEQIAEAERMLSTAESNQVASGEHSNPNRHATGKSKPSLRDNVPQTL